MVLGTNPAKQLAPYEAGAGTKSDKWDWYDLEEVQGGLPLYAGAIGKLGRPHGECKTVQARRKDINVDAIEVLPKAILVNGDWIEDEGRVGWDEFVKTAIYQQSPDTLVTLVECHI